MQLDQRGLALRVEQHVLRVDFAAAPLRRRLLSVSRREALVRACGAVTGDRPVVLDATAGLGADAMLLAARGCRVYAWERHPVVWALLADGLRRAADDTALCDAAARVTLHCGDARDALAGSAAMGVRVGYADPMFEAPGRGESRLALRLLTLVGAAAGEDGADLVRALRTELPRTVVKRRRRAMPLAGPPGWQIDGGTVRFDVYA